MKKVGGSIAGGGKYGIGPIAYLASAEAMLTRLGFSDAPLPLFFVYWIGESVGAILAALLACGWTAKEGLALFLQHVAGIFGDVRWRNLHGLRGPKYSDDYVVNLLKQLFGDRTMSQTRTPLFIGIWDFRNKDLVVFGPADTLVPIWYAVRCSMAATTYFAPMPGYTIVDGKFILETSCRFGDGGFGANDSTVQGMRYGFRRGLLDARDTRLLELVTSGLNPERKPVDPGAFILEELQDQVLPAITTGNSSHVYETAVDWLWTLGQPENHILRVRPPCADRDMDDQAVVAPTQKLWEDQFEQDADAFRTLLGA